MSDQFTIRKWRMEWWITVETQQADNFQTFLRPSRLQARLAINWQSLELPFSPARYYRLSPPMREELKAAIRKRSHIPGNSKSPFYLWKKQRISFEAYIVHYQPSAIMLLLRSTSSNIPLTADDMMQLSYLPSTDQNQLRYAIEKMVASLQLGDVFGRSHDRQAYGYYPCIQIVDYSPRTSGKTIEDDVPWHHLASIGTRHVDISEDNTQLVPAYKAKNYSIRNDVCVIDKQSLLIVSPRDYLEFGTIRHCISVCLQIKSLLRSLHASPTIDNPSRIRTMLSRIQASSINPSALTDSISLQQIWSKVLTELQVTQWIPLVAQHLDDITASQPRDISNTPPHSLGEDSDIPKVNRKHNVESRDMSESKQPGLPQFAQSGSAPAGEPVVAKESAKKHVIISLHGIRTRGEWQKHFSPELSAAEFIAWPLDYGFFGPIKFLNPWSRRKQVDWFRDQYTIICQRFRDAKISIVAHSMGTYIVARSMEIYPEIVLENIIFCGAIVRRDYPWARILGRAQVQRVLNDYGKLDIWARVVEWVVIDSGQSGLKGFIDTAEERMVQRSHSEFRHSDYFYTLNYQQNWIPFLQGKIPPNAAPFPPRPRNWKFSATVLFLTAIATAIGIWFLLRH